MSPAPIRMPTIPTSISDGHHQEPGQCRRPRKYRDSAWKEFCEVLAKKINLDLYSAGEFGRGDRA